jgi:hypothetical protein
LAGGTKAAMIIENKEEEEEKEMMSGDMKIRMPPIIVYKHDTTNQSLLKPVLILRGAFEPWFVSSFFFFFFSLLFSLFCTYIYIKCIGPGQI